MTYRSPRHHEPRADQVIGTVTELFAGVGGFRLALARSGLKTVFSNQWEPSTVSQQASECYTFRFGLEGHLNENFTELLDRDMRQGGKLIPKTDVIVGGFPCQDYSVAKTLNSSKGIEGKKGVLWWDIHKLIKANNPSYVFLENVDRLLNSPVTQRGRDFAIMLKTLGSLGYIIEWRDVNAADYGFAQRRKRVLIVASRITGKIDECRNPAELIYKKGILARALPVMSPTTELRKLELISEPDVISDTFGKDMTKTPFANAGVYIDGIAYTATVDAKKTPKRKVLGDMLQENPVAEEFWIDNSRIRDWKSLKGAKKIERTHKRSGTKYFYAEGSMAFPDSLDKPSRTILTGEGGSAPSRFKHVIEIDGRYRRLTPLELERLNGFPDDWTRESKDGVLSDSKRAFFMGNALIVGLIARVGKVLAEDLIAERNPKGKDSTGLR